MKKVLVAMSGGVDSSVAAYLLKNQGYQVVGITMYLGIPFTDSKKQRCCDAHAIEDAKKVCEKLGILHHVIDFSNQLQKKVIDNFISEYSKGRTPNPCIECNKYIKFGILLKKALALGFDYLATGHYAAIEKNNQGEFFLKQPKDKIKDQTYFLYAIGDKCLKNTIFPLDKYLKEEVREIAREADLPVADKPQSQDICFIPNGNYREFIKNKMDLASPGEILDINGNVLGQHQGVFSYTIGQREGVGISAKEPLYVISIDPENNKIVLGGKDDLKAREFIASDLTLFVEDLSGDIFAKIRYTPKEIPARATKLDGKIRVVLENAPDAITPGQSVVLYKDEIVLGGGIIEEVLR